MKKRSLLTNALIGALLLGSSLWSCKAPATDSTIPAVENRDTLGIDYIDLVHCTHTDYGYTDHPLVAIDLHKRYIDIALDMALETQSNKPGERFAWTVEALDPIWLWWQEASDARKKEMLKMVKNGQIGINSMPFHIHPFINDKQWKEMMNWIPDDVRQKFNIEIGMQHDVNGFPRSAAQQLLDKNIRYIWTGINAHWGCSPFQLPTAFWWKMPDNRQLLVWAGYPYWEGYAFFADKEWRAGQREANNTQFSWPRGEDILACDEATVRKAHERCIARIKGLKEQGYDYNFVTLSFTNQWRMDNDGPIAQLVPFIQKWNELGLRPALNLTTAANAMKRIEKEVGGRIDTLSGEWQDWWSFGLAASPREVQAARRAASYMKAVESPFWGKRTPESLQEGKEITRMLCRYYEHTFASNETTTDPFGLYTLGQLNEKNTFAYRPLERAKWLLAQQMRTKFTSEPKGLYLVNTGAVPYTGWITLDETGFRGANYQSVTDVASGELIPLLRSDKVRFWVTHFPAQTSKQFELSLHTAEAPAQSPPILLFDKSNWIASAQWDGMQQPLFTEGLADFMVLTVNEMNRWALGDEYFHLDSVTRKQRIDKVTTRQWAIPMGKAKVTETPYTTIVEQELKHPRLASMKRCVEIYKEQPRIKVRVTINRLTSMVPEVFYLKFPLPANQTQLLTANGGVPYIPYEDHLPNSCKDFFVVDGWVKASYADGARVWSSNDVPLVNFGGDNICTRIQCAPANKNELFAMLYNSIWVVNFQADCPGEMNFEFELFFDKSHPDALQTIQIVDTYATPLPIMNNPAGKENEHINKHMNTPRVLKLH